MRARAVRNVNSVQMWGGERGSTPLNGDSLEFDTDPPFPFTVLSSPRCVRVSASVDYIRTACCYTQGTTKQTKNSAWNFSWFHTGVETKMQTKIISDFN